MAQQDTPYLIPFGDAGMVAHPNRWRAKTGELFLAENVVVENDLLQKDPSATFYDRAGIDLLEFQLSYAVSETWVASLNYFLSDAPTTVPPTTPTINTTTAATPASVTLTLTSGAAIGTLHAIRVGQAPDQGGISTMVDSKGHTYTRWDLYNASGMEIQLWAVFLTHALVPGDTLTYTVVAGATVSIHATAIAGVKQPLTFVETLRAFGTSGAVIITTGHSQRYPVVGIGSVLTTNVAATSLLLRPWVSTGKTVLGQQLEGFQTTAITSGNYIIAQTEWDSEATNAPAGTVSVTRGSTRVTGVGTAFPTAYRPGDDIIVGGESQVVNIITSNLVLDTIDPWDTTQAALAHVRRAGPTLITVQNREHFTTAAMYKEDPDDGELGLHGNLDATVITSTLNQVRLGRFVVGGKEIAANNRKLFYLNGVDYIRVLSGDGVIAGGIANGAADWGPALTADPTKQPLNAIVHQDSLVAFGNLNDPHRLYFSNTSDHEDFRTAPTSTGITLRIASNVGQRLYCAAQYQGVLFVAKYPNGIFYIDDTPIDRLQWSYRVRSMALGVAPSPHAMLATDSDVIFCDPQGHFHLLSAVNTLGGTRDSDLTRAFGLHRWTEQNVDVSSLERLVSVYDDQTKTAWFGVRSLDPPASDADNDLIIRWDFGSGSPRMTTSRFWLPNTLCLKHRRFIGRQAVLIGEIGDSWLVEPGAYGTRTNWDVLGAHDILIGINTRVDLPETDLADTALNNRAIRKRFVALEAIFEDAPTPTHPMTVELRLDGILRQTLTYEQSSVRRIEKMLTCGDGYTFQVRILTDGSVAGDLGLIGLIVYYQATSTGHSRPS